MSEGGKGERYTYVDGLGVGAQLRSDLWSGLHDPAKLSRTGSPCPIDAAHPIIHPHTPSRTLLIHNPHPSPVRTEDRSSESYLAITTYPGMGALLAPFLDPTRGRAGAANQESRTPCVSVEVTSASLHVVSMDVSGGERVRGISRFGRGTHNFHKRAV